MRKLCIATAFMMVVALATASARLFVFVAPDGRALTGMKSTSTSPVPPIVVWNDPYTNYRAFFFNGDTNSSGSAINCIGISGRDADNVGGVISVPVSTNVNGRVQYAYQFSGVNHFSLNTNYIDAVTSIVFAAWIYPTQIPEMGAFIISHIDDPGFAEYCFLSFQSDGDYEFAMQNTDATKQIGTMSGKVSINTWQLMTAYWNAGNPGDATNSIDLSETCVKYSVNMNDPYSVMPDTPYHFVIGWDEWYGLHFSGLMTSIGMYTNAVSDISEYITWRTNFYYNTHPTNGWN